MFVKLTYRYADDGDEPLWVRADSIVSIHRTWIADDDQGTNRMEVTRITADCDEYWVRETPEEIRNLISHASLGY